MSRSLCFQKTLLLNRMSQSTDFYMSWLGFSGFGVGSSRPLREPGPPPFSPLDISGLQLWMEANDSDSVNANVFGIVLSWKNKGLLGGQFDLSGTVGVTYGSTFVNGEAVVNFPANAYMAGNFAMNFQDRTILYVYRRNTDISGGVLTWLTSDTANGLESGVVTDGSTFTYVLAQHPGSVVNLAFADSIDRKHYAVLVSFSGSSTNTSNNYGGLNSIGQTLSVSQTVSNYPTTSIPYVLGNFVNGTPLQNDVDMCEILIYDSVLDGEQRDAVSTYLMNKWNIGDPPAPPKFAPTDVPGIALWLDASDTDTVTTSGSNVTAWADKSGTSRTVTLVNSPTYTSGISVNTDIGVSSYFLADVDIRKTAVPYMTMFLAYTWPGIDSSSSNQALWGNDVGGGFNRAQLLSFPAVSGFDFSLLYGEFLTLQSSSLNTSNQLIYSATLAYNVSNATYVVVDGVSSSNVTEAPAVTETTSTDTYFASARPDDLLASVNFNEIIMYTSASSNISTEDREKIEIYLTEKWVV